MHNRLDLQISGRKDLTLINVDNKYFIDWTQINGVYLLRSYQFQLIYEFLMKVQ